MRASKPTRSRRSPSPRFPIAWPCCLSGQLKAATLPQPFATIALQQGGVAVVDDIKYPDVGNSVVSFRKKFIDEHPQAVQILSKRSTRRRPM